jgi:DNA-binding HxlR family transcriptional regulator
MSQRNTDVPARAAAPGGCPAGADLLAEACTLGQVIDHVGGKWSVPILLSAIARPVRFSELERTIQGISRRMLTLTLRNLERDGLLTRTVYPTVPPRVEYTATGMARELGSALAGLAEWAERHRADIAVARAAYDARELAAWPSGSARRGPRAPSPSVPASPVSSRPRSPAPSRPRLSTSLRRVVRPYGDISGVTLGLLRGRGNPACYLWLLHICLRNSLGTRWRIRSHLRDPLAQ